MQGGGESPLVNESSSVCCSWDFCRGSLANKSSSMCCSRDMSSGVSTGQSSSQHVVAETCLQGVG